MGVRVWGGYTHVPVTLCTAMGQRCKHQACTAGRANLAEGGLGEETQSSPRGDDGRARAPTLSGTGNLCPELN